MTLKAIGKVNLTKPLQFTVVGAAPGGVAKVTGLLLAGSGGQAGTNYVATVTTKKVKPVRVQHDRRPGGRQVGGASVDQETGGPDRRRGSPIARRLRPVVVRPSSLALPGGPMALTTTSAATRILGIIPTEKSRGLRR